MAEYPEHLIRHRALFNGMPVTIRPIRGEDSGMEQEFVRHLSEDSRYFRFMGSLRELPEKKLRSFTHIDYLRQMAFVATIAQEGREIEIGTARYAATEAPGTCEFAIVVDDAWQGSGVAGLLMISLIHAARENGYKTREGSVPATNHKMPKFARQLGFRRYPAPGEADLARIELQL